MSLLMSTQRSQIGHRINLQWKREIRFSSEDYVTYPFSRRPLEVNEEEAGWAAPVRVAESAITAVVSR